MVVRTGTDGGPAVSEPHPWWDWSFDPEPNERDWTGRVLGTLTSAAREMAIADVPLGVFLSGGVDSSSVVAALAQGGERVKTFTIGFDDAAFDERQWARAVAERYGTEHHERVLEPHDADAALQRLMWHFDEPFGDHSFLPTYYLAAETRTTGDRRSVGGWRGRDLRRLSQVQPDHAPGRGATVPSRPTAGAGGPGGRSPSASGRPTSASSPRSTGTIRRPC